MSRRELLSEWAMRRARHSPREFRRLLRLAVDAPVPFAEQMQPWQVRDFGAIDPAWRRLAGHEVGVPFRRAYWERPRGHAKTSDTAAQLAWILLYATRPLRGLAAAADRDQANLIWDAIWQLAKANRLLLSPLEFRRHGVVNPRTGCRLEIISADVSSSWGALPDFVICDELCHWEQEEMWQSLLSSSAKKPQCVLVVLTNAGVGRGWQWEVREAARTNPQWYFSSLDSACAPWISDAALAEQRDLLPRPVYLRLWENRWQHSDGEFVTLAEAEACRKESLSPVEWGEPNRKYFAAIDYAEKHDRTVGVVVHRENDAVIVDRMDVACPTPETPVPVRWVEEWIAFIAARFRRVTFIVDEYQLLGTLQRLEDRFDLRRFEFAGGRGNHALALNLRKLIVHRHVRWPSGCGQISGTGHRDDLETELAALLLKQSPAGLVRIDHPPRNHDDRAFSLGVAALHAVREEDRFDWMQVTPPSRMGGFFW